MLFVLPKLLQDCTHIDKSLHVFNDQVVISLERLLAVGCLCNEVLVVHVIRYRYLLLLFFLIGPSIAVKNVNWRK